MIEVQTENAAASEDPRDREAELKARRAAYKKGAKAIETLKLVLERLSADDTLRSTLSDLESRLEAIRPPDPRKCKEYKRAIVRKNKGLLGIPPEDVALYCQCAECDAIRTKLGIEQPEGDQPPAELIQPAPAPA